MHKILEQLSESLVPEKAQIIYFRSSTSEMSPVVVDDLIKDLDCQAYICCRMSEYNLELLKLLEPLSILDREEIKTAVSLAGLHILLNHRQNKLNSTKDVNEATQT